MSGKPPIRVVAACGLGTGTALYLKMTVEEILKKAGIPAVVETADATLAPTISADIIVTGPDLAEMFHQRARAREIVAVTNYGNKAEIQEKLQPPCGGWRGKPVDFLEALDGRIRILERVSSWEEAVRISGELLAADGLVTPSYVDHMVRTCQELGPYIAIAPGVAIPHARPEDGANGLGLSLVVVREGVRFGSHNDPVRVLIAFATPDRSAHIDLLRQLAELLARADALAQAAARLGTPEQWKELVRSLIQNPP